MVSHPAAQAARRLGLLLVLVASGCGPQVAADACRSLGGAVEERLGACGVRHVHVRDSDETIYTCTRLAALSQGMTVRYDPDAVAGCRAEIAGAACDTGAVSAAFLRCLRRVFVGTQRPGSACVHFAECDRGTCASGTQRCPGICVLQSAAGQTCTQNDCEPGLVCTPMGRVATCAAPPAAGQRCGQVPPVCAPGAFCKSGTCEAQRPEGSPCLGDAECLAGTRCFGPDQMRRTCTRWQRLGEPCARDDQCVPGLLCEGDTCARLLAASGEACGRLPGHIGFLECATGFCATAGETAVCSPLQGPGQECGASRPCQPGTQCSSTTMGTRCVAIACF